MTFRVASGGGGSSITLQTNAVANASQTLLNLTNGANVTITDGGGGSISIAAATGATLNGVTAATGAVTIASGNNTGIVWNWANTTDSTIAFTVGETSAATNGTSTAGIPNQVLLKLATVAASTQSPLSVYSRATHVFSVSPTTAQVLFGNGAVGTPVIAFAGATTTGFWSNGTNIQASVGGVSAFTCNTTKFLITYAGSATSPALTDGTNVNTGLQWPATNTMAVVNATAGEMFRFVGGTASGTQVLFGVCTFANLGTPANGSFAYCSDCDAPTLVDSTCTSAGAKTGSFAARVNATWKCFT